MQYKLIIDGTFADLNDYIKAERITMRQNGKIVNTKGNILKKESQEYIIWYIRKQLKGLTISKLVFLDYMYYEPNTKRDKDNVSGFFHKVFQDSLVLAGTLSNDGWKNIKGFKDDFDVDKNRPRIEVTIVEVGD